jgi:hypothetical protein
MMLANIAWILASNGKRVLMVDWDLEAPGLHRYFSPFLADKDLTSSEGIINFVANYKLKAMTPPAPDKEDSEDWYLAYANPLHYACALKWNFPQGGRLDLIPAGRQDQSYSALVNSFDWQEFYERLGGGKFLEAAKQHMKKSYEYILIDSRTGVSDTSGICTLQLPDDLVVCYTLNNQSIRGAATVATAAADSRKESLRVFPIPTRVDTFEKDKLELRRQFAKERFARFPAHLRDTERELSYRATVQIPYIPYYAYEEILATFGDTVPAASESLLASAERILAYIAGPEFKAAPVRESLRQHILTEFRGTSPDPLIERAEEALEIFSGDERETAKRVLTRLVRVAAPEKHLEDKPVSFAFNDVDEAMRQVSGKLQNSGIVTIGQEEIRFATDTVLRSWPRLREWLDDDREFLLWRQDLWKIASDWRNSRDKQLLHRGADLKTDVNWQSRRKADLLPVENKFIGTSQRRAANKSRISIAATILLIFLAALNYKYFSAEHSWKLESRAQIFATGGVGSASLYPIYGTQLVLTEPASGGVQIWNAKTGTSLYSTSGTFEVNSPGSFLIAENSSGSAEVIEMVTGRKYAMPWKPQSGAHFDYSGRFIILAKHSGQSGGRSLYQPVGIRTPNRPSIQIPRITLEVWNLNDRRLAGTIDMPRMEWSGGAYVSEKGDRLITNYSGPFLSSLWDLPTGMLLAQPSKTSTMIFASDVNEKKSFVGILSQSSSAAGQSALSLWDLKTGKEISALLLPDKLQPKTLVGSKQNYSLDFSPDGSYILVQGWSSPENRQAAIFSTADLKPPAVCPNVSGMLSANGHSLAVCSAGSADTAIWYGSSPRPVSLKGFSYSTVEQDIYGGNLAWLNEDRSRLLVIRKSGKADLWNFVSGQKIRDLDISYKNSSGNKVSDSRAVWASYTLDGKAISVRLEGGLILLYAIDTGERIAILENASGIQQEVYYDAECRQANVWTDTGLVLRYTEGKEFFRLFIRSRSCAKQPDAAPDQPK